MDVFVSSEEETKFLRCRFANIEDVRLPGAIAGDGDTENIDKGLLELRAGHEKRKAVLIFMDIRI